MEWLKNMGLKKCFFLLSLLCMVAALLLILAISITCKSITSNYPTGGITITFDGTVEVLEQSTPEQMRVVNIVNYLELFFYIAIPICGLGAADILFYHLKLKMPITALQSGTERIQNHDLDFSLPNISTDELGQVCAAFEMMRMELLNTNQELWRQAEERKRLNAAFSHDLRNPVMVIKGTIKLLQQNVADEHALDRLETYTLRIERYVEAMSSIQRLEQMPVQKKPVMCSTLKTELKDTAKLFAASQQLSVSVPDTETVILDHGLFLTVAENLIGNAVRFAQTKLAICMVLCDDLLFLSVMDDGPGYPAELVRSGPKPFGKMNEDAIHFGMGLYTSKILCQKHGGTLELENRNEKGAMATAVFRVGN